MLLKIVTSKLGLLVYWGSVQRISKFSSVAIKYLWVIPCQINKQNVIASQISTKLGGLVPSMKLFNHAYFGRVKLYGFGNIGPTFF